MKSKLLYIIVGLMWMVTVSFGQRPPANPQLTELLEQKDQTLLQQKLQTLENSDKENDLNLLLTYYNRKRNEEKAAEITKLIDNRFPNGKRAFDAALDEIFNERDGEENEKKYADFMARFSSNPMLANHRFFDFARYYVAVSFLGQDKPDKVLTYLNLIQDSNYKTNAFSFAAREAITTKDYKLGENLIRKVFADVEARGGEKDRYYYEYLRIGAKLLLVNKHYKEGFPYAKEAYENDKNNEELKKIYLDYLVETEHFKEAYPMMEEALRKGNASAEVKEQFERAYIETYGSNKGFKKLETSINEALTSKIRSEVASKMINEPAFNFTATTLDGKQVSLSDFKGKVVVLDFWATWCGPCKASFPKMQAAVDKYEDNPNVVFLFIHTWETNKNPVKGARDYIESMGYTFNVLMDLKDAESGTNRAATGYSLRGIPAKFVIDKKGNIRFSSLGAGGSSGEDAFLQEMAAMIDIAASGA